MTEVAGASRAQLATAVEGIQVCSNQNINIHFPRKQKNQIFLPAAKPTGHRTVRVVVVVVVVGGGLL